MTATKAKGKTSARGYGTRHQALRKRWARDVEAGGVHCFRCGRPILPGTPWDLGHIDGSKTEYRGPEHRTCNRQTEYHGVKRNRRRVVTKEPAHVPRLSRLWTDLGPGEMAIVQGELIHGPQEADG